VECAGLDGDRYAVGDWGCDQRCICSSVAEGIGMRTGRRRSTTVGDEGGRQRDAGSAAGGESYSEGSSSVSAGGGGEYSFWARQNWGLWPQILGEHGRSLYREVSEGTFTKIVITRISLLCQGGFIRKRMKLGILHILCRYDTHNLNSLYPLLVFYEFLNHFYEKL
jgi:hypothetical protein